MTPYYEQDGVTIYHGDCREVLPGLDAADLILTDPPYGVGLAYASHDDSPAGYDAFIRGSFIQMRAKSRALVVTPGVVNLSLWLGIEKPRWTCIWVKPNQCSASALNGFNVWEPVLVYGKHRKPVGQDAWVMSIGTNQAAAGDHPCPKWYPFWASLAVRFSEAGDVILDPFMGSGTTLEAAKNNGCCAIGIEIEEKYCEIAAKRLQQGALQLEMGA